MAKTTRKQLIQFGASGPTGKFGQFGSLVAGAPTFTKDPAVIQQLTAWLDGWQDAVYGASKAPLMEDMNGIMFVMFYQLFYLIENGIPEWDANTTYYLGSLVRAPSTSLIYQSLTDGNLNQALPAGASSNSNWNYGTGTLASNISGLILDAQISGMSSTKLIGQILDAQINGMTASKLIGLISSAQINTLDGSKLTGAVNTALLSGSIPGTQLSNGTVGASKLNTATGFVSGSGGTVDITINDYSFYPSFQDSSARLSIGEVLSGDSGNTVGRYSRIGGSGNYTHRWRYVTGSDNPRMWIVLDKNNKIIHAWEAEDPANHGDIEDGYDEIMPFNEAVLEEGQRIVRVPVIPPDVLAEFFSKIPSQSQEKILKRFHTVIEKKGWMHPEKIKELHHPATIITELPQAKIDMGTQWFLRHIFGKANIAQAIHSLCEFSPNDGILHLPHAHAEKVTPTHIALI